MTAISEIAERLSAGERLSSLDAEMLAKSADLLTLGMLADDARRRRHGDRATFLRVAALPWVPEGGPGAHVDPDRVDETGQAGEWRLVGVPTSLDQAVARVTALAEVKGTTPLSGFSLRALGALAAAESYPFTDALKRLRDAGLDAIAEVTADALTPRDVGNPVNVMQADAMDVRHLLEGARAVGIATPRVTVTAHARQAPSIVCRGVSELQDTFGGFVAFAPLPRQVDATAPTTGYDDVRQVALARLLVEQLPSIQVDWSLYGPKLAQVALAFGADDLDAVSPAAEAGEGRRRAPLEEVRRNIRAAFLEPVERNGRFEILGG